MQVKLMVFAVTKVGEIVEDPAVLGVVQREHGDDRPGLQDRQRGHGLRSDGR